jgi:formylglycine-generating enzyme required for sulfatase activity
MINAKGVARVAFAAEVVLLAVGGAAFGQTHAPWPTDWNNWSDPALWVTVGNKGNTGELSGAGAGGIGPDRICGAVNYEYRIGKYEVTAGQYTAFLNAVAATDTYGLYDVEMWSDSTYGCRIKRSGSSGNYTYSVASDWANRPVNDVSWGDAARYANWLTHGQPTGGQNLTTTEDGSYYLNGAISNAALMAVTRKTVAEGGRYYIPTEDEWYKAAYHKNDGSTGNYFDYPIASDSVPSNDLIDPDPGNNANFAVSWPGDVTIGSPYYRTPVGEFELSDSPYGTFDQSGNVWEWNEAVIESWRGLRGGSFSGNDGYLHAAHRHIGAFSPSSGYSSIGFRVSEVPEPATMSLLALGGLALVARRRKKN